jgi:hypothetical protein
MGRAELANEDQFVGTHTLDDTSRPCSKGDGIRDWRLVERHPVPVGGAQLADAASVDPTGKALEA